MIKLESWCKEWEVNFQSEENRELWEEEEESILKKRKLKYKGSEIANEMANVLLENEEGD